MILLKNYIIADKKFGHPVIRFAKSVLIRTCEEEDMEKYLLNAEQINQLMEKAIDLFLEYQYKHGYDEPMAKSRAVMDVIGSLKALGRPRPVSGSE